jgi:tetratricopeptide (TPR) repeat protein
MAEPARPEVRYTAFLSYSHKDAAAAGRLHRRLEAYRMPKRLAGSAGARGPVPERLWPIFRDREELPAATDLSETVREALAQSGALIILCSPAAAGSLWVAEEIETFRTLHPDRPILAAILDGDPPDCFPAALRAFGRDGTWHEPLATDLRRGKDGAQLGLLKLVAGITGVGLDALVQRDAARRVRRVMAVTGAAVVAMLIMAALAVVALQARREAERQRAEAEGLIEFMLTDLRQRLEGGASIPIMAAVNQRALQYYGGQRELEGLSDESLEQRARILHTIGADYRTQGHLNSALAAFREGHRITAEQLERAPNDAEHIFNHSQSEYWIGSVDDQLGNFPAALAAYRRYHAQAERLNRMVPNDPRFVGELGYAESNLGGVNLNGLKLPRVARRHYRNALGWFQRAARLAPRDRAWRVKIADMHAWLSDTWNAEGRFAEARVERLEEQRLKQRLLAADPGNQAFLYATIISTRSLARVDREMGEYDRAMAELEPARAPMMALLATDPTNLVWRDQTTQIESDRARLFALLGRTAEARVALDSAEQLFAEGDRRGAARSAAREQLRVRLAELRSQIGRERR